MSKDTGSVASSGHSWLRLYAAVAMMPLALVACGGGGGGSPAPAPTPTPTPSPSPSPSLTVTPSATTVAPGGAAITLTAAVVNSSDTPTWTLSGAGTLSAASGTSVQYTPPAVGSVTANTTVTISAALTGATTQSVGITLVVTPIAGLNWTSVTATSVGNLQGIDYADGHFVAVSDTGGALASTDAVTWSPITLFSGVGTLNARAIAHIGSNYVAVGSAGTTGAAAYSTDGVTWTMAGTTAVTMPLHGVIGGSTRFIGLGEAGNLYSSTDGHTWAALTALSGTGIGTFNAGAYGGGHYVAVGDNGFIAASTDSVAWGAGKVVVVGGVAINLHGVAWTGTQFVAVGDSGTIAVSADGSHWSPSASKLTGALRAVAAAAGGEIVVVGDSGIETSEDGITWTVRDDVSAPALSGVAFGNGKFAAVGTASAIRTSSAN
jgi:hypothetical protein